ncbi:alternate-type signal peptide domain-containing protein [Nocardioides massiliensis]|uniref:Alternate signal-mediated exported protein n=1 Tax=Nocardioides massiliensis TaxID=1325935 RepID=A0ABT9NRY2_9ACTN|nr:alternate-type signal peptide domain-containing protein [Nocardioides massiliensis]MDP9822810.1 alternate signal-mediated exported protein [Nocardioides massiliensis]
MRKEVKATLALGAAGALLVGGAGTLAFWTDEATLGGASLTSGKLAVDASDCDAGAAVWTLEGDAFDPATDRLIPGDTLTMTCDVAIDVAGTHLTQVDIEAVVPSGALAGAWEEVTVAATVRGTATGAEDVTVTGGTNLIPVVVTVTWPHGTEDNDLNGGLTTTLGDIVVAVAQDHQDD